MPELRVARRGADREAAVRDRRRERGDGARRHRQHREPAAVDRRAGHGARRRRHPARHRGGDRLRGCRRPRSRAASSRCTHGRHCASSPASAARAAAPGSRRRSSAATGAAGDHRRRRGAPTSRARASRLGGRRGRLGKSRLLWEFFKYVDGIERVALLAPGPLPVLRRGGRRTGRWRRWSARGRGSPRRNAGGGAREAASRRRALRHPTSASAASSSPGWRTCSASRSAPARRPRRPVQRVAAVLRADGRRPPGGARVRGPAVGRQRSARLHRLPARVVGRATRSSSSRSGGPSCRAPAGLGDHASCWSRSTATRWPSCSRPRARACPRSSRPDPRPRGGVPLYAVETCGCCSTAAARPRRAPATSSPATSRISTCPRRCRPWSAARLDGLSRGALAAQDAAVLGCRSPRRAWRRSAAARGRGRPSLEGLVAKQVLATTRTPSRPIAASTFLQALLRTVAYGTLAGATARRATSRRRATSSRAGREASGHRRGTRHPLPGGDPGRARRRGRGALRGARAKPLAAAGRRAARWGSGPRRGVISSRPRSSADDESRARGAARAGRRRCGTRRQRAARRARLREAIAAA